MYNLQCTWSYHTLSFLPLLCPFCFFVLLSYCEDGMHLYRLRPIQSYPSREVGMQVVSSTISGFRPHLRLSKLYNHHSSVISPVLKTLLMYTPPSCRCSMQCPFQSIEMPLLFHLFFKLVKEFIHSYQPITHG